MHACLLVRLSLYDFVVQLLVFMTRTRLGAWLFPFIDGQPPLTHQPRCHHPYGSSQQGRGCPSYLVVLAARCSQSLLLHLDSCPLGKALPHPCQARSLGATGRAGMAAALWGWPPARVCPLALRWACVMGTFAGLGSRRQVWPSPSTVPVGAGGDWPREPSVHALPLAPVSVRPGPTPPGPERRNPPATRGSHC